MRGGCVGTGRRLARDFIVDSQNKVIFMYSRSTVASAVSCASGNKKSSGVLEHIFISCFWYSLRVLALAGSVTGLCAFRFLELFPLANLSFLEMVSSGIPGLTKNGVQKLCTMKILLPIGPPDTISADHEDLDFSDVFGPTSDNFVPRATSDVKNYDTPMVIQNRSHALVGPSHISQLLQLTSLEKNSLLDLVECSTIDTDVHQEKACTNDVVEKDNQTEEVSGVGLDDFEVLKLVGQGAFGKVFQVRKKGTSEIFAMKVMRKDKIIEKNHAAYMKAERDILTKVDHPFIVQLRYSFQVMLTDFGLAKEFDENARSNSMCGTVEYMAPEIITGKGHDKAADWWSVGVLLFEMLTGKPPFIGGNRDKIQQKIVKEKMKLPAYLSTEAHSLLKGLLQKEVIRRLGNGPGGSNEIKNHKWFKSINWRKLDAREIQPSFRPNVADQLCIANFDKKYTSMPLLDSPVASPVAGDCDFSNFSYVRPSNFLQKPSFLQSKIHSALGGTIDN
ncbi:Serine/threonine-protein kinase [Dendrobium catenatum]|uniref:Serine/threonine-protein kinase n=1 Tax=Dendrobium catenatum TaxID=906689 RepID=A0A2I0VN87_9ASPA|nr:Serine/threonine-protein kinase [Dendrobium catenatum]